MAEGQRQGQIANQGDPKTQGIDIRNAEVGPVTLKDLGISAQRMQEARTIAQAFTPEDIDVMVDEANAKGITLSRSAVIGYIRPSRSAFFAMNSSSVSTPASWSCPS